MKRFVLAFAIFIAMGCGAFAGEAPLHPTRDCSKEMGQMGLNACTGANLDAANAALGKLYGKLLALNSDPKDKAQFRDVERAWVAYKDKECALETAGDEGGSIQAMEYNECEIEKTDARIRELEKMAGCTGSPDACNPK